MKKKNNSILVEDKGLTKKIILNRPEKRNALDEEMIEGLTDIVMKLDRDSGTRTVVITGSGGNFCSGLFLDYLNKISEFDIIENKKDSAKYKDLLLAIYNCSKPTIAMVDGYALAGGCGIATACDLIVASDKAQFGYTEVKIGFIPAIVMIFLLKRVSETHAKDLLITSKFITGETAYEIGLVNYLVEQEKLGSFTEEICGCLNEYPASSVMLTKEMFRNIASMGFEASLEYASDMNAITRMTPDCKSGIRKFLTKK